MTKKLQDLLSEVFEDVQKVDKHKVSEGVRNYGIVGKQLYNNTDIMEIAEEKKLKIIEDCAHAIETTHKGRPVGTFGDLFDVGPTKLKRGDDYDPSRELYNRLKLFKIEPYLIKALKKLNYYLSFLKVIHQLKRFVF